MDQKKYKAVGEGHIRASNRRIVRRHRKVEESKVFRRSSMVVGAILAVIALLVLAGSLVFYFKVIRQAPEAGKKSPILENLLASVETAKKSDSEVVVDEQAITDQADSVMRLAAVLDQFSQVDTAGELVKLVRDPEIHREAVETYLKEYLIHPCRVLGSSQLRNGDSRFFRVRMNCAGKLKNLFVDPQRGLMDWESFAGFNAIDFDQMQDLSLREEGVIYRFILKSGSFVDYHNFDYSDADEWVSYQLEDPDGGRALYAYVKRGSELQRQVDAAASVERGDGGVVRKELLLRVHAESQAAIERRQLRLLELVSDDWLLEETSSIADLQLGESKDPAPTP